MTTFVIFPTNAFLQLATLWPLCKELLRVVVPAPQCQKGIKRGSVTLENSCDLPESVCKNRLMSKRFGPLASRARPRRNRLQGFSVSAKEKPPMIPQSREYRTP